MAIFGYGRVSSKSQNPDRQIKALKEKGVSDNRIFVDMESGRTFDRPEYRRMFRRLRKGDILVIVSIDRLGRSHEDLMEQWRLIKRKGVDIRVIEQPVLNTDREHDLFGSVIIDIILQLHSAFAQAEREAIHQRQAEGIAAAKARGRKFGRPLLPVPENFAEVYEEWEGKHISGQKAAELLGVSADTFRRWREKYRMEPDTFMSSSEG